MKPIAKIRRRFVATATAVVLAAGIPGLASAVPINLSGTINEIGGFDGTPFNVGDSVAGAFNVDLAADNSFNLSSLTDFSLAIGAVEFNNFPTSPRAIVFNGQVSDDGSTVTDFSLRSFFGSASNMDHAYALQFSSARNQFSATDTPFLAKGSFAATVANAAPADVSEPSSLALFGLAVAGLAFARSPTASWQTFELSAYRIRAFTASTELRQRRIKPRCAKSRTGAF